MPSFLLRAAAARTLQTSTVGAVTGVSRGRGVAEGSGADDDRSARHREEADAKFTKTILIADDQPVFRHGLASLLRERDGWEVVAETGDGEEAARLAGTLRPRIAILDIEMPGLSGIQAAQRIRRVSPETRIVVLSMYADARYQERAREAGASAYVLKSEPIAALVDVIDLVMRGASFVSNTLGRGERTAVLRSARVDLDALSAREREVLRLLAEGRRTQEIAELLGLGVKSVETYRSRLMEKLGIDNVAGLVRFAIRAGVIAPEG